MLLLRESDANHFRHRADRGNSHDPVVAGSTHMQDFVLGVAINLPGRVGGDFVAQPVVRHQINPDAIGMERNQLIDGAAIA